MKGRIVCLRILLAGILMFGMVLTTQAATITVSPDGTKNYTTIQAAINAVAANDTIEVYPGEYDEQVNISKAIILRAVKGPVITKIMGAGDGITINTERPRIEGFTITKSASAIVGNASCDVYNCILTGLGGSGFTSVSDNKSFTFVNCLFLQSSGNGVFINCSNTTAQVRNSLFFGNVGYALNNTWGGFLTTFIISDFCCFFNNKGNFYSSNNGGVTIGSNCITSDPSFRNADEFDFRLKETPASPCINAGDNAPGSRDPDGTRNDIGVFGGPYCASFWYGPQDGPAVTDLIAVPPVVQYGSTFQLQGTAVIY